MKLNNFIVTRYNTGFRVELVVFAQVRSQFTDAMLSGEGHDPSFIRAALAAARSVLSQRRELNSSPA